MLQNMITMYREQRDVHQKVQMDLYQTDQIAMKDGKIRECIVLLLMIMLITVNQKKTVSPQLNVVLVMMRWHKSTLYRALYYLIAEALCLIHCHLEVMCGMEQSRLQLIMVCQVAVLGNKKEV